MSSSSAAAFQPGHLLLGVTLAATLLVPAWWLAGRLQDRKTSPFFHLLLSIGLALVGYLTFVNLLGRLTGNSIAAVSIYFFCNVVATTVLWWRWPTEFNLRPLASTWGRWIGPVLIAVVLGLPQWLVAVSTNYWDEGACSGVQITAPNQFAEGVFPPRHNALPDVVIKYHYGFTILSGTVEWLTNLSANVSIDVVSTALWVFVFLFVYFWLRELEFDPVIGVWGGFAVLLSGGLSWLYLPQLEAYGTGGYEKVPPLSDLLHRYDASKSWLENVIAFASVPSLHLRNADGTLSNLPWDIGAQFQQHAVSLGIALTVLALYLFCSWQARKDFHRPLLALNIATFGVLFLGHAVFGGAMAAAAGLYLLGAWLSQRTRVRFFQGLFFVGGLSVLAFLHGGMLITGPEYGAGDFATFRHGFGYAVGGLAGFLDWNLAGFGLPLLLTILGWCLHRRCRDPRAVERNILFALATVFTGFCYLIPQLMFYSSETSGVEEFTEISKFFFCVHLGVALLSVFGFAYLPRALRRWVILPGFLAAAIGPLAFCYANCVGPDHQWLGFYHAPYFPNSIEQQMGEALRRLKHGNRDVYFDASADERRHGFLSELLFYGGSAFTLTPSRFERTGTGFRLAEPVVARRFVANSRMARLRPGAAEESGTGWYYSHPFEDMACAPVIVRSRFAKLVAQGRFQLRVKSDQRALYSVEKPTADLDQGIELFWQPKIVSQATMDRNGNGKDGLVFYDYVAKRILAGEKAFELPAWLRGEFAHLYVGRFPGDPGVDFLFARMADTDFRFGKRVEEVIEHDDWTWTYGDSSNRAWQPEYRRWLWDTDIPFIADIDHEGFDRHMAYRPQTREWILASGQAVAGPGVDAKDLPLPFGGRFLSGSRGDLGLWSLRTGDLSLRSLATGQSASFKWGGAPGDILVPGDYDGDGYDEIAVWQRSNQTWYWRHAPDGEITQVTFGSATGIPIPWDYNHDGRLDLAYWEPANAMIFVSYDQGKSVALSVPVPPHSIPGFVNWE